MIVVFVFAAVFAAMALLAIGKKPGRVYKNEPDEQNPMQGHIVISAR